eukprot:SAG31_NODE_220_length_19925_cov_3.630939_5_plen_879_part_00
MQQLIAVARAKISDVVAQFGGEEQLKGQLKDKIGISKANEFHTDLSTALPSATSADTDSSAHDMCSDNDDARVPLHGNKFDSTAGESEKTKSGTRESKSCRLEDIDGSADDKEQIVQAPSSQDIEVARCNDEKWMAAQADLEALWIQAGGAADQLTETQAMDGHELARTCTQDGNIVVGIDGSLQLAGTMLLANEGFGCSNDEQLAVLRADRSLSMSDRVKVDFLVPEPGLTATLTSKANIDAIFFVAASYDCSQSSGVRTVRLQFDDEQSVEVQLPQSTTPKWTRATVASLAGKHLAPGLHSLVLYGAGDVYVEPQQLLANQQFSCSSIACRSSRSYDGGDSFHVGVDGGECLVRLQLPGCPSSGTLEAPPVNVLQVAGMSTGIQLTPSPTELQLLLLAVRHRCYPQTCIMVQCRWGHCPGFTPQHWTAWLPAGKIHPRHGQNLDSGCEDGNIESMSLVHCKPPRPGFRFFQYQLQFQANARSQSPVVLGASIRVARSAPEKGDAAPVVRLLKVDQPPPFVRSTFNWAKPSLSSLKAAAEFARLQNLPKLVAAEGQDAICDEAMLLRRLRSWVTTAWVGWLPGRPLAVLAQPPANLLSSLRSGNTSGQAAHAATLFVAAAVATGFPARIVVLYHHVLAEVWLGSLQKWVVHDVGVGRLQSCLYYRGKGDEVPLSALELSQLLNKGDSVVADMTDETATSDAADFAAGSLRVILDDLAVSKWLRQPDACGSRQDDHVSGDLAVLPASTDPFGHSVQQQLAELDRFLGDSRERAGDFGGGGWLWWDGGNNCQSLSTQRDGDFENACNQIRLHAEHVSAIAVPAPSRSTALRQGNFPTATVSHTTNDYRTTEFTPPTDAIFCLFVLGSRRARPQFSPRDR